MFTGIVETTVRVIAVTNGEKSQRLTLAIEFPDLRLGQSIAVNGVCLTIAEISDGHVGFDVIQETLARTNLGLLEAGDEVHVERSLRIGDRLDGHFVQGHVDGPARIVEQRADAQEWRIKLECPSDLAKYLAPKGSVTLDGVSLTIAALEGSHVEVALIPTTVQMTTLARRPIGWQCNMECDILAKTVISWMERKERNG
jgi:riboflavin synthase